MHPERSHRCASTLPAGTVGRSLGMGPTARLPAVVCACARICWLGVAVAAVASCLTCGGGAGHEQLRREPNWGALETVNCWWSADGGRLFVHLEEGSISIFTFQKPASRKQRRPSMSAKQRILSSALAAVSLPPPN